MEIGDRRQARQVVTTYLRALVRSESQPDQFRQLLVVECEVIGADVEHVPECAPPRDRQVRLRATGEQEVPVRRKITQQRVEDVDGLAIAEQVDVVDDQHDVLGRHRPHRVADR